MSLTVIRLLPAFLLLFALAPALGSASTIRHATLKGSQNRHHSTAERLELYAPRVRRSTVAYLRLRLLELREQGLDRARAAIERRLSVDELVFGPAGKPAERELDRVRPSALPAPDSSSSP